MVGKAKRKWSISDFEAQWNCTGKFCSWKWKPTEEGLQERSKGNGPDGIQVRASRSHLDQRTKENVWCLSLSHRQMEGETEESEVKGIRKEGEVENWLLLDLLWTHWDILSRRSQWVTNTPCRQDPQGLLCGWCCWALTIGIAYLALISLASFTQLISNCAICCQQWHHVPENLVSALTNYTLSFLFYQTLLLLLF